MTPPATNVYPRVLVVNGEPFTHTSATGLTLSSLFGAWPKSHLACLYDSKTEPDLQRCAHYWHLNLSDVPLVRCVRRLLRKPISSQGLSVSTVKASLPHWTDRSRAYRRFSQLVSAQSIVELDHHRVSSALLQEIENYRPDVIYTMLGSNRIQRLTLDIARHFHLPIVPHFMDDWPTTLFRNSVFRPLLRPRLRAMLRDILQCAPVRLVISDAMASEYSRRYGGAYEVYMNAVEDEVFHNSHSIQYDHEVTQLVYVGGLHLNRWRSLQDIGRSLSDLAAQGVKAHATIYTQARNVELANRVEVPGLMHVAGSLTASEVPSVLRDADILVHVESFDRRSNEYARYSMSTKLPEYMAAGRPILAYGPEDLASIQYIHDSEAGLSVGRRRRDELAKAIQALVVSSELRTQLGERGQQVAMQRHAAKEQREKFRASLLRAAYDRS